MPTPVYLVGAARTDFKRNLSKEGRGLREVLVEAGREAIAGAGIDPSDVGSGVVGNFAGGLFTRQLHLGAFLTEVDPRLRGIPTMHVEAACASGGAALLAGAQQVMAGLHDVVLVVGAEQQKTMSPADGADVLGAAGDYHAERRSYGQFMFPKLFAHVASLYGARYGLTEGQLARVAFKNRLHARLNPCAQTRDAAMTLEAACTESPGNPRVAPPLKVSDCSQITDGAAAVVLCSERFARSMGQGRRPVRLLGFGHTTDYLLLDRKDVPECAVARRAVEKAYAMAGLGPADIDGADVHDCFSISEIIAYELLGLAERGGGPALVESGATVLPQARSDYGGPRPSRSIPVNPGGGLMGDGHPVGATGVRQAAEAYAHLTDSAGARQVPGARRYLTFNMGGTFTTSVVRVWGRNAD